ncbi:MAG: helix-turn-helix domain-containing protein [Pseudonocardiaceae bacterium]|nr:helix-turn-helix domain-containing protein [Pseudonocardiaceae bacterium]
MCCGRIGSRTSRTRPRRSCCSRRGWPRHASATGRRYLGEVRTPAATLVVDIDGPLSESGKQVDENERTIGRRLREIRIWRRKTLKAVAELAGISEGHLSRIERGEHAVDRRSLIVKLANALQVAPSDLTQLPMPPPANGDADATIDAVRHAMMAVSRGRPGGEVRTVDELRARVEALAPARDRDLKEVGARSALAGGVAGAAGGAGARHPDRARARGVRGGAGDACRRGVRAGGS